MRKKGFTLIELLAVIVILAIIALIATPIILSVIEKAKKGAAEVSATNYVGAIESYVITSELKGTAIADATYNVGDLAVELKGEPPTSGTFTLEKGIVKEGTFCMNGYNIEYKDNVSTATGKCGEESKKDGELKLSKNSITMIYPIDMIVDVETNKSGGTLSCTSSDEEIATCSITDNIININPGTKEGNATITITSSETEKYKEAKAAILVITQKGTLSYTVNGYEGTYDGKGHSITISSSEAEITYSTDGTNYSSENPSYTDAGTYTVYYKIEKAGYNTITGSETINISKATGRLRLSNNCGNNVIAKGGSLAGDRGSTGYISTYGSFGSDDEYSCSSSDENVATCSIKWGSYIKINGISVGTADITITVTSDNYTDASAVYSVSVLESQLSTKVCLGDYISMTPTSTLFTTDISKTGYDESQTLNPSELNLWRVIKINTDGTIEVVSEYVSSIDVYFKGLIGYQNYTGYLNEIASQYENNKYTVGSRHMGYNGQTEYITDTSMLTSTTLPWAYGESRVENLGGGDIFYSHSTGTIEGFRTDYDLVGNALDTTAAYRVNTTTVAYYWLSSRYYIGYSDTSWSFNLPYENNNGVYFINGIWYSDSSANSNSKAVRPILTLKSGLTATGSGTDSGPYVLP